MGALFSFVAILGTLCALMAMYGIAKGVWWLIRALRIPELLLAGLYYAAECWDCITERCGKIFARMFSNTKNFVYSCYSEGRKSK